MLLWLTAHRVKLFGRELVWQFAVFTSQAGRVEVMKIHGASITKKGDIGAFHVSLAHERNVADRCKG